MELKSLETPVTILDFLNVLRSLRFVPVRCGITSHIESLWAQIRQNGRVRENLRKLAL